MWEVRHAGLLGIKYEVAVRSDLVQVNDVKDSEPGNKAILRDVVDATVLGYVSFPISHEISLTYFIGSETEMMTCVLLPHPACSRWLAIS